MYSEYFTGFLGVKPVRDYAKLVNSLPPTGCTLHNLGRDTDNENSIYAVSCGDLTCKPVIWMCAGVHGGTEWGGVHSALEFMKAIGDPSTYSQQPYLEYLRDRFSFYLIVCVNPWAYINGTRRNKNDVDLNRQYNVGTSWADSDDTYKGTAAFSEVEVKRVVKSIQDIKPFVVIDVHERLSDYSSLAGAGVNQQDSYSHTVFRAIFDDRIWLDEITRRYGSGAGGTELRYWASSSLNQNKEGGQIFSFIVESGPSGNTTSDIELRTKRGINAIMGIVINYADMLKAHRVLVKTGSGFSERFPYYVSNGELLASRFSVKVG